METGDSLSAAPSDYTQYLLRLRREVRRDRLKIPLGYAALFAIGIGVFVHGGISEKLSMIMPSLAWALIAIALAFTMLGFVFIRIWERDFQTLCNHIRGNLIGGGILARVSRIFEDGQNLPFTATLSLRPPPTSPLAVDRLRYALKNYRQLCTALGLRPELPSPGESVRYRANDVITTVVIGAAFYLLASFALRKEASFILVFLLFMGMGSGREIVQSAMLPSAIKQAIYDEFGGAGE